MTDNLFKTFSNNLLMSALKYDFRHNLNKIHLAFLTFGVSIDGIYYLGKEKLIYIQINYLVSELFLIDEFLVCSQTQTFEQIHRPLE